MRRHSVLLLASILTCLAQAQAAEQDLTDLDLATLMSMDVKVTSASRREQATSDAAAAVYVITRDEIKRSGATSLPEVLRLAPGVQVARINSRSWAVTTRGFNSRFATKLLVMIDGRSIYTPLFSGVIWEDQSMSLDRIERVEVVRGPGGALWGINAVNGVINIITRKAGDEGLNVSAAAGSFDSESGSVSYDGHLDSVGNYRLYADHSDQDSLGNDTEYETHTRVGVRVDHPINEGSVTLQSNFSHNDFGKNPPFPATSLSESSEVGDVSLSWQRKIGRGQMDARTYYSWSDRGLPWSWDDSAAGLDLQYSADRIGRHVFTAGAAYLYSKDKIESATFALSLTPAAMSQAQWSVYAQDELHFFDDAVRVIAGAKLEDLKFTGLAFQPTLRAIWHVDDAHTFWAAASRATRTPSRTELHAKLQFGFYSSDALTMFQMDGEPSLGAEELHAYEIGWRWRPHKSLSFDVTAYRNEYEHLIAGVAFTPQFQFSTVPTVLIPMSFADVGTARVDGAEIVAEWAPVSSLRFEAQATLLDSGARSPTLPGSIDPKVTYSLRGIVDLSDAVRLDLGWRSVSKLEGLGVKGYDSFDARIAWQPVPSVELALSAENVLDDEHVEFSDDLRLAPGIEIGRTVFARFTWRPH